MSLPTTQWTMLAQATLHGDTAARESLESFCRRYRGPVITLLRRRGVLGDRVEDLTHDFFLQLMERSALKRADPRQGRFRSYLSGALTLFLSDDVRRNKAQKRGGGVSPVSLDACPIVTAISPSDDIELSHELDRAWVLHLVASALETVRKQWSGPEKAVRFEVLRAFLPGAMEAISQEDAAARLGLSDGALRTSLCRLRDDFRAAVRAEVVATVACPGDADDEMRYLLRVLRSAPPNNL